MAAALFRTRSRAPERALERLWGWYILRAAGLDVCVRGLQRFAPGASFILMPNHRSWFDIPVLFYVLGGRDVRWVGKKEVVAVPILGWSFGLSRHIVIDRQDREQAVAAIRRAGAESRDGVSILIFPEGTRSPTGRMLPFKKGGFHLAVETGLPLLPVAIAGTRDALPKGSWTVHPGRVEVAFCEPIHPGREGKTAVPRLMEAVRGRLERELGLAEEAAAAPKPNDKPTVPTMRESHDERGRPMRIEGVP